MNPEASALIARIRRYCERLGVRVQAPYSLEHQGERIEALAFLPDFGSGRGIVVGADQHSRRVRLAAEEHGLHWSIANLDSWRDEGEARATLDDWQFFGPPERRPSWYSGTPWGAAPESVTIAPVAPSDAAFVRETLEREWFSTTIWSRDRPYDAAHLPGFIASINDLRVGLVTYSIENHECEVVTLISKSERSGVGTALLAAVTREAMRAHCTRLYLTTSKDNLHALRFYQRRAWRIVAVHPGAIDRSRAREPALPLVGPSGIESHDELELELRL